MGTPSTCMMAAVVSLVSVSRGSELDPMTKQLVPFTNCLDGSNAGYYWRPASTERGRTTWVIYLEGGGLCYSGPDCHERARTNLGSSTNWADSKAGGNSQSTDSGRNPDFWDANHVFVPYCTGDLHVGMVNESSPTTYNVFFSGHINLVRILQSLIIRHGIASAKHVLLSGDSAGGMGTFFNVDWLQDQLPNAVVKGAPIGGWFFPGFTDDQKDQPWAPPSIYPDFQNNRTGSSSLIVGYLVQLYRVYFHPSCKESQEFHCGTVNVMINNIAAPIFVSQNMYDTNQIGSELFMPSCSGDSCTPEQLAFVRYYGRSMRNSLTQYVNNITTSKQNGLFMPSCWAHTEGINVGGSTKINGFDVTAMIGDWFWERSGRTPLKVVDDCREELPCNPTCQTLVPEPNPDPETQCETELNTVCSRYDDCFECGMKNLKQLLDALCTVEEINRLCNNPPVSALNKTTTI